MRAWDYAIEVEKLEDDVISSVETRYYFSEGAFYAEEDEPNEVVCAFDLEGLKKKVSGPIRFKVVPRSGLLKEGAAILSEAINL